MQYCFIICFPLKIQYLNATEKKINLSHKTTILPFINDFHLVSPHYNSNLGKGKYFPFMCGTYNPGELNEFIYQNCHDVIDKIHNSDTL